MPKNHSALIFTLDFHCGMNVVFLVLGFLHGVRGEFTEDVSKTAVSPILTGHELNVSETSSVNSPRTPCKNPKTKQQL
jgi:hypothetical protein